jgi:hypothetical protein
MVRRGYVRGIVQLFEPLFFGSGRNLSRPRNCVKIGGHSPWFPSSPIDSRDFELGTFNPEHADGGVRMRFYRLDSAGHAAVDVRLRGDACKALGEIESVALRIPIEAAAIDNFIQELRTLGKTMGASAFLRKAK